MHADWILTDARIWPGGPEWVEGAPLPLPTTMALRNGRILALGTPDELTGLRGRQTAVHSLEGKFVMPGFVDAHVHLQAGGLSLHRLDLRGVSSPEEFIQRVADRTRSTPEGGWILGGDWSQEDWEGGLPTREWLDRAAPKHPVFLHRRDLHMGVANSLALALAGVDVDTPDPDNGRIDRASGSGEPTGVLREFAIRAVSRKIPPPTEGERRSALRAATLHALSHGVTQLHDKGALHSTEESWRSFRLLQTLREEGRLPVRVLVSLPLEEWKRVAELVEEEGRGDDRLRWGGVKGFVDGSLGSTTAWFHEPYLGEPRNTGGPISDLSALRRDVAEAVEAGLQPALHAIGDRANDWILGLYEELSARHPERDLRLRVEHGQHMTPAAIERAGKVDAVYSVQPLHLVDDASWAHHKLGPEREKNAFPFRSLERAGVRLAFGSDWTVAPLHPLAAVQSAVTRRARGGQGLAGGAWIPEERMRMGHALAAHTYGSAAAGFMEGETGSLAVGKRADFVVLSESPFEVGPENLLEEVRVEMTFVDGTLAYKLEDALSGTGP